MTRYYVVYSAFDRNGRDVHKGSAVVELPKEISSFEEIKELQRLIKKMAKDDYGQDAKAVIVENYIEMKGRRHMNRSNATEGRNASNLREAEAPRQCPRCGNGNFPEGARFCMICGLEAEPACTAGHEQRADDPMA